MNRSRTARRRRASGLLLVLLLFVGVLPVHGEHLEHAGAPAGASVPGSLASAEAAPTHPHGQHGHPGHHDHHGRDDGHDGHDRHDHEDTDAPCPRGPCPAGAPACAVTLGAPVLPSLEPGQVHVTPKARFGELPPPSVAAESLFRPPRGEPVTPHPNPAG